MAPALSPDPNRSRGPWAHVSDATFADWGWQLRNRVENLEDLRAVLSLSPPEVEGFEQARRSFRFGLSPYYVLLAHPRDPKCPMRRQMVPSIEETAIRSGELADPLGEESLEVVPNLIHRYPDRVLLLATDRCPVYCRFCTRRRIVGRLERQAPRALLEEAFAYIAKNSAIREVIISGGDALMLSDSHLDHVLGRLRAISHLDIIRVASRMPVTCPMRVTPRLAQVFAQHAPVYLMTHFNHPHECTPWAARAVAMFVERGVPVWNQSVLLRGVNDDVATMKSLNRMLVWMRVVPYYMHQCDMAEGIEHFRTPMQTGIDIIEGLRGHVSGLLVPKFCVDVPGGLGKVTVQPDWVVERAGRRTLLRTHQGRVGEYLDPRQDLDDPD